MNIVALKQGTKLWHEWRGKGLGASDAPAAMGECKWRTPFELWGEKTGLLPRKPVNEFQVAAMAKGTEMEPYIREAYQVQTGRAVEAIAAEMDGRPHIRASFDGVTQDRCHFAEFKWASKEVFALAQKGKVPLHYKAQVYAQRMIGNFATGDFVAARSKDPKTPHELDLAIVAVPADLEYEAQLLQQLEFIWRCVCEKAPPPLSDLDFLEALTRAQGQAAKANELVQALSLFWRARL